MGTKLIMSIGDKATAAITSLVKKPAESVISVKKEAKGWKILVEVLERRSIPDTQDILGRYELLLDGKGEVTNYRQVMLRRRSEFKEEEK